MLCHPLSHWTFFSYHLIQCSLAATCDCCSSSSSLLSTVDGNSSSHPPRAFSSLGWSNPALFNFIAIMSCCRPRLNFSSPRSPGLFGRTATVSDIAQGSLCLRCRTPNFSLLSLLLQSLSMQASEDPLHSKPCSPAFSYALQDGIIPELSEGSVFHQGIREDATEQVWGTPLGTGSWAEGWWLPQHISLGNRGTNKHWWEDGLPVTCRWSGTRGKKVETEITLTGIQRLNEFIFLFLSKYRCPIRGKTKNKFYF